MKKTWPYGTRRGATVVDAIRTALVVTDDQREGHIILDLKHDQSLKAGDVGMITFTEGGPLGGYWKFTRAVIKDPPGSYEELEAALAAGHLVQRCTVPVVTWNAVTWIDRGWDLSRYRVVEEVHTTGTKETKVTV